MKLFTIGLILFSISFAHAEDKIKMYYTNANLLKIVEDYSKATGQKFVVDKLVGGDTSILIQEPLSKEEAFNQLSSALAVNGYAISKQGDTMIIMAARNVQRDLIEVSTEVPSLKPERMATWVYTAKNIYVGDILKDLRILSSRDGEFTVNTRANQIIFSDWTSNLNRVAALFKVIDVKVDAKTAQFVASAKKEDAKSRQAADKGSQQKQK